MSSSIPFANEEAVMQRALEIARCGIGHVEPNPAVGAVIVDSSLNLLGEGYHQKFGAPHAEVMAFQQAGERAHGQTLFVTLEPCSHHGKTPPCADAVLAAGIKRVVIGAADPASHTSGQGIQRLRNAGVQVDVASVCSEESQQLIAPFRKLMTTGLPYVHAKWAMTLDGKIATRTGSSQWISNEHSRKVVHELRGRMDVILTGIGTVLADDPLLTARPAGARTALRVILDRQARLPLDSQLAATANDIPTLVMTTPAAATQKIHQLKEKGIEIWCADNDSDELFLLAALKELGRRQCTNLLIEAGEGVLGAFRDSNLIDEIHCFIAPKVAGGKNGLTPMGGIGCELMSEATSLIAPEITILDGDVYIRGSFRQF